MSIFPDDPDPRPDNPDDRADTITARLEREKVNQKPLRPKLIAAVRAKHPEAFAQIAENAA